MKPKPTEARRVSYTKEFLAALYDELDGRDPPAKAGDVVKIETRTYLGLAVLDHPVSHADLDWFHAERDRRSRESTDAGFACLGLALLAFFCLQGCVRGEHDLKNFNLSCARRDVPLFSRVAALHTPAGIRSPAGHNLVARASRPCPLSFAAGGGWLAGARVPEPRCAEDQRSFWRESQSAARGE